MSVYVCLKQVPNLEGVPSGAPESGFRLADAWYLNPLDAYALRGGLETAAALHTDCVALSFGGPETAEGLRQALGLGAERAIRVCSDSAMPGPGLTAWALAGAIRLDCQENCQPPGLIFCGRQSSDVAGMQVPYRLAACLGVAVISEVSAWAVEDGCLEVLRQAGSLREYLEADPPCVLALNRGQGAMPAPTLPGLIRARKKSVRSLSLEAVRAAQPEAWAVPPADPRILRAEPVTEAHQCRFVQGANLEDRVGELVRLLRENGSLA